MIKMIIVKKCSICLTAYYTTNIQYYAIAKENPIGCQTHCFLYFVRKFRVLVQSSS